MCGRTARLLAQPDNLFLRSQPLNETSVLVKSLSQCRYLSANPVQVNLSACPSTGHDSDKSSLLGVRLSEGKHAP
jgi:hypothetical protein